MSYNTYEEYKDSEISWVGEIPEHWINIKVKHYFYNNKRIANDLADNYERLALTLKGVIKRSKEDNEGLQPEKFETYQIIKKNSLIFKLIDLENISTSRVGLSPFDGLVSPAYINLIGKNNINMSFSEKYFLMMWKMNIFNKLGSVGVRSNLNLNDLLNLPFIVPPLEEQNLISNYLDKKTTEIDKNISKNKELISLLEEKKVALINQCVTKGLNPNVPMKDSGIEWIGEIPEHWEVKKLKNIASIKPSNVDKKSKDNEPDVLLCNYTDVYYNEFITNDLDFMKATASYDQINKLSLNKGDIIITKDSESADDIGVPAIVTEDLNNVVCGYHLTVVKSNLKIFPKFLFRSFESKKINDQFYVASNGITRFALGLYDISNSYICMPPFNEQIKISEYMESEIKKIHSIIKNIYKQIDLLEEYKQSLIHHAVTGKIDVRGVEV